MTPLILISALLNPDIDLSVRPTKGANASYEASWHYEAADESSTWHEKWTFTIGELGPPIAVSFSNTLVKLEMDGVPLPVSRLDPLVLNETWGTDGGVTSRDADPHEPVLKARYYRLFEFRRPEGPVKSGSQWSAHVSGSASERIPGAKWDYELLTVENGTATVAVSFSETDGSQPISAEGRITVNTETGWMESCSIKASPCPVPGDEERTPCLLTLVIDRSQ